MVKSIHNLVCGLDVHKDSVFLCIQHENGEKIHHKFGILTDELECMRDFWGDVMGVP